MKKILLIYITINNVMMQWSKCLLTTISYKKIYMGAVWKSIAYIMTFQSVQMENFI